VNDKNTRTSIYIISVGIILSITRYFLQTSKDLVLIMALINIIALNFVIYELINNIYAVYYNKIKNSEFSETNKNKYRKKYRFFYIIIQLILFFVFSPLYIIYHCETSNDILSILSLCISIATPSISYTLSNMMYNNL